MTDDEAETGGIQAGDLGNVEDVQRGPLFAGGWLELEDVDDSQGLEDRVHVVGCESSSELEDENASFFIFCAFDGELLTLP
jgi:hypothetical protein